MVYNTIIKFYMNNFEFTQRDPLVAVMHPIYTLRAVHHQPVGRKTDVQSI